MLNTPALPHPCATYGTAPRFTRRTALTSGAVLLGHALLLWALLLGLQHRSHQHVTPAEILVEATLLAPAAKPKPVQPTPPASPNAKPVPAPHTPTPQPVADTVPATSPVLNAPPAPPSPPAPSSEAKATAISEAARPAPAKPQLEPPSSDALYLNNPSPAYPRLSKRLGEQGTVIVRVLIGLDGKAEKAEIRSSSGFDRLDQAALDTVLHWRYVPGKRNGVPEAMWFNVPIRFVLE